MAVYVIFCVPVRYENPQNNKRYFYVRITALEHAARRTASAIIIHYHRILLGSIKMRWQIVTAATDRFWFMLMHSE